MFHHRCLLVIHFLFPGTIFLLICPEYFMNIHAWTRLYLYICISISTWYFTIVLVYINLLMSWTSFHTRVIVFFCLWTVLIFRLFFSLSQVFLSVPICMDFIIYWRHYLFMIRIVAMFFFHSLSLIIWLFMRFFFPYGNFKVLIYQIY